MSVGGVDLNLLITLRALLEEENVTHAGSRLGLSQPSMSIALGRLRRHYKDELLVRNGRGYCLTPLARALLPSVTESLRLVDGAFGRTETFVPGKSDQVFRLLLSDYAVTVLIDPLLRRVREEAPMAGLKLSPIPADMQENDRGLRDHDLLIGPLGFAFPGESEVLFRDRWVCIVDPANSRLRDGWLSLDDIDALPHAAAFLGHSGLNPADRVLDELGVRRRNRRRSRRPAPRAARDGRETPWRAGARRCPRVTASRRAARGWPGRRCTPSGPGRSPRTRRGTRIPAAR